jgi:hypothetical protein
MGLIDTSFFFICLFHHTTIFCSALRYKKTEMSVSVTAWTTCICTWTSKTKLQGINVPDQSKTRKPSQLLQIAYFHTMQLLFAKQHRTMKDHIRGNFPYLKNETCSITEAVPRKWTWEEHRLASTISESVPKYQVNSNQATCQICINGHSERLRGEGRLNKNW